VKSRHPQPKSTAYIPVAAAEELLALIEDNPGDADEGLLDQALAALRSRSPQRGAHTTSSHITLHLTQLGGERLETLITHNRDLPPNLLTWVTRILRNEIGNAHRAATPTKKSA
jgi:hypothetical protein